MCTRQFFKLSILFLSLLLIFGCNQNSDESAVSVTPPETEIADETDDHTVLPKTIAVIAHTDFVPDRTEIVDRTKIGLPDVLVQRIIEHLTHSKRFIPVDRTALRRTILEQRFGQDLAKTYLDQSLDKAIDAMENVDGGSVHGVQGKAVSPSPIGGGIAEGTGSVGTTGTLSDYNDILKDFQDLGSTVGADYLVLGNLEKLQQRTDTTSVPYSTEGRTQQTNVVDARINLRIIDTINGTIVGATSLRAKVLENIFTGKRSHTDEFTAFDHIGRIASAKILDVIYPARIVNEDPLLISRGSNDGTHVNDVYLIEREGKDISDSSGQVIARLKDEIGRVQVVSTQETVAIVKPINGEGFLKGDLAKLDAEASKQQTKIPDSAVAPLKGSTATLNQRPRVAVVLIKSGSTETPTEKSAEQHTPIFTDTIISRLVQTKRFEVVDRQEVDQLLKEQTLQALREGRDLASAVGTLQGADYLLYGSLASFSVEDKQTQLPGSSRIFKQKIGYLEGNMRIVDARSGQILESRKISLEHQLSDAGAKGSRIVTELADAYAEQVVLMLMNKLYPIRVAAVGADSTIYINRGDDGGLYPGEILDAYRLGAPVIDPETGVQLGQEEITLGQVKVDEVEDARSKGTAVDGAKVVAGNLLKRSIKSQGMRSSQSVESGTATRSGAVIANTGAPGQTAKPTGDKFTIVVGQLKIASGAKISSSLTPQRTRKMTNDLIFKLTNTNRFKVLDRQEIDQILDEKGFEAMVSGGQIDDRIRELIGADYLIHGDINNFYIDTQTREVPYLDELETIATAVATGVFRIVDVHSAEVKAGDKVRISFVVNNIANLEPVEFRLQDEFSTAAVGQILLRLFPIKVLGVAGDGIVYLNRGIDAGLQNGETFDVMRPGQKLIDPDTGRSFGTAETKVAAIKIVAVEESRSRANVVSGDEVLSGDIIRKSQAVLEAPEPEMFTPNW